MNASLNAVVSDISKRIKEQEEERLAQDAENSSLRSDLQVLLDFFDIAVSWARVVSSTQIDSSDDDDDDPAC